MQTLSNTAKVQMISYLKKAAEPHQIAVNSMMESAKENVIAFIGDNAESVSNIQVDVISSKYGHIWVKIEAGLNDEFGLADLFISEIGLHYYTKGSTAGDFESVELARMLHDDAEFTKYANALYEQYIADWLPFNSYTNAATELEKSIAHFEPA